LPDRAGKTRACLTAGPNQPEHKKTDTPHGWDRSVQHSFLIFLHSVTTARTGENPIKLFPSSSTHNLC
ncbi:hypothetical protein, partial [Pseudomonas meliae]|uniref:hypothetical protein n=1 Tax=Pseudomonas meliae TaxID=86176 RepID=UPI001F3BE3F0